MTRNPDAERSEDGEPEPGNGTDRPAVGPERPGELAGRGAEESPASEGPEAEPGADSDPASRQKPARREPVLPVDEEAAWASIVAGYGREPDADDSPASDNGAATGPGGASAVRPAREPGSGDGDLPVRSFTVYSAGTGPRDYLQDDDGDDDEGHFVPPEPPPLPEADPTTKFAWLAALGGPLLLFGCMLTGTTMTWWLYTLAIGGFLGGFATLVARMRDDGDDEDDPGRGAVV